MNQYIVNDQQAKALSDGASLLIIGIDQAIVPNMNLDKFAKHFVPLKQGDEIFIEYTEEIPIEDDMVFNPYGESAEHTKIEITRFKRKVGEVSVKRVQEISIDDWARLSHRQMYEYEDAIDWLKDQGINYSANPWVALVELKGL